MPDIDKRARRRHYDAPARRAAAARTREDIVRSARRCFERRGWNGATIRDISDGAHVSVKTAEALFGTKGALLRAAVEYAIRGDVDPTPMPQRESVREMERAPNAVEMLHLHAAHLRSVNPRSARIASVVEHAALSDDVVADLWRQMNHNRRYAVRWAARTLLSKPGRKRGLRRGDVEAIFWVALDWGTFRTLADHAGLDTQGYERWLRRYYAATLLP